MTLSSVLNLVSSHQEVAFEHRVDEQVYRCRLIQASDDEAVRDLIIDTLTEFGCVGEGYAYADEETQHMSRFYDNHASKYWVIESVSENLNDVPRLIGGGGFGRLKGTVESEGPSVCEVQKLYFNDAARGKGLGTRLLKLIIQEAKEAGYQQAYLETVPQMKQAQGLYAKLGFCPLTHHMGQTGHHEKCSVRMLRDLS